MAEITIQFEATRDDYLDVRDRESFAEYRIGESAARQQEAAERLADLLSLRRALDDQLAEVDARVTENVGELHYLGQSWAAIAPKVGLSTAGAHRRYGSQAPADDASIR